MTQKIAFSVMSGSGIVATLIIAGIALKVLNVSTNMAETAIGGGIGIGIVLGILGIVGVLKKLFR